MEAKSRSLAAGALVLAAGIAALWFASGRGGDEVAPPPTTEAPRELAPASAAVVVSDAKADAAAATPAVADAPASTPQRSEVPVVASKNATLRGRCVDAHGAPLADCKVHLHAWTGNSERMDEWLTEHGEKPEWKDPPDVITAADGMFEFAFWPPAPFQFALDVTHDGCGAMSGRWTTLAEGSDTDVGDVPVTAGVRVTGRVVDANGVPQAKEYVTLRRRERRIDLDRVGPRWGDQAVSGADGTFATRGWLLPGEYEVRTQQLELQSPKTLTLVAERLAEDITVVVAKPPASATITGYVLDETGAPASGVDIEDRSARGMSQSTSKRDGTFELRRQQADGEKVAILALYSDTYDFDAKDTREVEWGATDVEFHVARAGVLTLRVTDLQEAPVETYAVRLIPRNRNRWSSSDSRVRAPGKHENGTVVIEGLTRGDWLLLVDFPAAAGFETLFEEFSHERGPRRIDLRAQPSSSRKVRVVAGDGVPVGGTTVQLCDPFDVPLDDARLVMQRDHWLMNSGGRHALVLSEGKTGADGCVELRGPAGRNLGICVLGPGHVPLRQSGVRLDVADELVVRVSVGAHLVGKIVPAEAVAELKRLAGNGGFGTRDRSRLAFTDGQDRRFPTDHMTANNLEGLRVADDGSFDVEGVPPGFWKVQVQSMIADEQGFGHGHLFAAGEVNLVDGQTTTLDLDLTYVLPGTLEGLVLLNGEALANGTATLRSEGNWQNVRTDAAGRFTKSLFPGEYVCLVQRQRPSNGWSRLYCPSRVRVVRGQTTTQTFAVSSSTLRVTVLDSGGTPVAKSTVGVFGTEREGTFLPPTDEAGVTESELTTEMVTLRILPKALSTPEAQQRLRQEARTRGDADLLAPHWIPIQTVALVAGQTTSIELHLPASAGY